MTQQEFQQRYTFDLRTDNIGGGSFGTVYKAYDNVLDREIAIKVSELKQVGEKEFSLLEEYKAIKDLPQHKNIAHYETVYRFESFQGVFDYAIMQYYPLGNLSKYLKNNALNDVEKEDLIFSILDGISFLHKNGVVQRDLKPSNILVVLNRNKKIIPKITDFGLSKQTSQDDGTRFDVSFVGGTVQYSSPEQLKGLPLKLNTDLWSFGVIVFEILQGENIFESIGNKKTNSESEITQLILHGNYISKINEVPEKWQSIIRICLERDMHKRVQTAEDIRLHFDTGKLKASFMEDTPLDKFSEEQNETFMGIANMVSELDDKRSVENENIEQFSNKNNADTLISEKEEEDESKPLVEKKERKKIIFPKKQLILVGVFLAFVFVAILLFNLMPTEDERWEKATTNNTFKSYENYLNKYPNGQWKEKAVIKLYDFANKNKTIKTYKSLLNKYPNEAAKIELDKLLLFKNTKEFNTLIKVAEGYFLKGKNTYEERIFFKTSITWFNYAKEEYKKAIINYEIDDEKARVGRQKVSEYIRLCISQQEEDKILNFSERDIYNENIRLLEEVLN